MRPDVSAGFPHAGADIEQLEPDGIRLRIFHFGALQGTPQSLEKSISGSVQGQSELIGQKTVATQAVSFALPRQFLDAVFDVTSQDIDIVIDQLRVGVQISHEKSLN